MATTTATKQVNVQPNHLQPTIELAVNWAKGTGTILMPQNANLSAKGNVSFEGGVRKGLRFEGDPATVLGSLAFTADGAPLAMAQAGVHASSPRVFPAGHAKAGQNMPNTGGNLTVCFTGYIDVSDSREDAATIAYQVQVFVTFLGDEKGYNLKARAWVKPTTPGGPQIVGEITGLTIE